MLKYKFNLQIKLDCPVIKANRLTAREKQILTDSHSLCQSDT